MLKNRQEGVKIVSYKLPEAFIWIQTHVSGLINVFGDIRAYLSCIENFCKNDDKFLCAVNYGCSVFHCFFKNRNLGWHTMRKYVTDACNDCGIESEGVAPCKVLHELQGTVITRLSKSNHSDVSAAVQQQDDILGGPSVEKAVCSTDGSEFVEENSTFIPNSSNAKVTGVSTNPSYHSSAASGNALFLVTLLSTCQHNINYSNETK